MNKNIFIEIVNKHKIKPNKIRNIIWAFLCGGITSLIGQLLIEFYQNVFRLSYDLSVMSMYLTIILIANILTLLCIFDKYSKYAGAGAFIPITGFANALTSSSLEGKSEGLILGIGSNIFRLAGAVITYGVSISILCSLIYLLFIRSF